MVEGKMTIYNDDRVFAEFKSKCVYLGKNGRLYAKFSGETGSNLGWYQKDLGKCWYTFFVYSLNDIKEFEKHLVI